MKALLALVLVVLICHGAKAQEATLGKSRAEIRELIQSNNAIKLTKSTDCDTLSMDGGLKTMMFYKNDVCYASKSVMPMKYMDMVTEQMSKSQYKKLNDTTWTNQAGTVKVEITVDKDKNCFTVNTSQAQAY
ncbi:hypothetical protein HQ865_15600 [Mucilaginibacter mali]|uniref:Uncharacterized protein n=1 Tax=Mucilaginibacter mali TaxID=2740462 RepID=A0A7D4UE22_9SPHI|nr:hypothetical protein [Mucilaginibacter mali]QKJ31119.1 hypothetical protein HQ865_15600 [Mucilaginibacter mali]